MEYSETVINEKCPRIVLRRPILTDEEREAKTKEIIAEATEIFWQNELLKRKHTTTAV